MKHAYTDAQLQAAIGGACKEISESPNRPSSNALVLTEKGWGHEWLKETPARLDLIKSTLAALPEPPTPTVDGKTPGQVAFEASEEAYQISYRPSRKAEWSDLAEPTQKEWEAAASAVLAAFGNQPQPTETPWTEWHGGPCPLKDEEVEEWEYKLRKGFHCENPGRPSDYFNNWIHNSVNSPYDIIAYRVLKWREGFGPVDWKAMYEDANKNLRAKFEPEVKEANARAEKAEAELAAAKESIESQTRVYRKDTEFLEKRLHEAIIKPSLSQLRPIAEAGPVPEGCLRYYFTNWSDGMGIGSMKRHSQDTHFADIRLPAEPKLFCAPFDSFSEKFQEAVKTQPETFEAHGKTWTKHTPGDAMPCDGNKMIDTLWRMEMPPCGLLSAGHDGDLAEDWDWSLDCQFEHQIIGWRYADEPTPEPLEPEPEPASWTPKVGDVVTLKSGSPKMTVTDFAITGSAVCHHFDGLKLQSSIFPTACLQPA